MGNPADGDDVDAGGGNLTNRLRSNAARRLGNGTATRHGDGADEIGDRHVVEQHDIGACAERLVELFNRVHLDFQCDQMAERRACRLDGGSDATGDRAVVVFDEHGVVQTEPVVRSTAHPNSVFLERAEAGRRLPGAHDAGLARLGHRLDDGSGQGGDAGQVAQQVERGPFGRQQDTRRTLEFDNGGAGRHIRAIAHGRLMPHRTQEEEGAERRSKPADPSILAGHDASPSGDIGPDDRVGGDVAGRPQVDGQFLADQRFVLDRVQRGDREPSVRVRSGHTGRCSRGRPDTWWRALAVAMASVRKCAPQLSRRTHAAWVTAPATVSRL